MTATYTKGIGQLVTDRYDFQKHVDGTGFKHSGTNINITHVDIPTYVGSVTTNPADDADTAITLLSNALTTGLPKASTSLEGIIRLSQDLDGTSTAPIVKGLRGILISPSPPIDNDVLTYDSSLNVWKPKPQFTGFVGGGDLSGGPLSQTVIGIQTTPVSSTPPSTGEGLIYDGSKWAPSRVFTGGNDLDPSSTNTSQTVVGLRGVKISTNSLSVDDVLTYDGAEWSPKQYSSFFTGGNDLDPTSNGSSQTVISITGDVSTNKIAVKSGNFIFADSAGYITISQSDSSSEFANDFKIKSQNAIAGYAGSFYISGGNSVVADGYAGGQLVISGGDGYIGGQLLLKAGHGGSQQSASIQIEGGSPSNNIGRLIITGSKDATDKGGDIYIRSGIGKEYGTVVLAGYSDYTFPSRTPTNIIEASTLESSAPYRRVAALAYSAGNITTTQVPSGSDVVFIGDTANGPTAGPTGGTILYSSDGFLKVMEGNGTDLQLGNPMILTSIANPNIVCRILQTNVNSIIGGRKTLYDYTVKPNSAVLLEIDYIALSLDGSISAAYKYMHNYTRTGTGALVLSGTNNIYGSESSPSTTHFPTVGTPISTDTIRFYSGYDNDLEMTWQAIIKIMETNIV